LREWRIPIVAGRLKERAGRLKGIEVHGGCWAWDSEGDLEFKDFGWGLGSELVSYFETGLIALKAVCLKRLTLSLQRMANVLSALLLIMLALKFTKVRQGYLRSFLKQENASKVYYRLSSLLLPSPFVNPPSLFSHLMTMSPAGS
jgi:hypothetical protein